MGLEGLIIAIKECTYGLFDSLRFWQSFSSSRTLRMYALKGFPLYLSTIIIGVYFSVLQKMFPDQTLNLWVIWISLWGLPSYVVGSLLQLRFAWLVTNIISSANPQQQSSSRRNVNLILSEVVYGILLGATYIAQSYIYGYLASSLLPSRIAAFAELAVSILMIAWATSFTAFESKLILKKFDLNHRIEFIETRWSYAIGYGLPASLVYNLMPAVFSTGLWQYLQLLLMLRALNLSLPRTVVKRLRIFRIAQDLATMFIHLLPETI